MINLLYELFPEFVTVEGERIPVVTDFREWVRFADMVGSRELTEREKLYCLAQWFREPPEVLTEAHVLALFAFYRGDDLELHPFQKKQEQEDEPETVKKPPLFDWCIDGRYVLGDFRRYYSIDLLAVTYLHWWEFRSLFAALPDESMCMKRIAYRGADLGKIKDKGEKKRIARIQREIAIPYLTEEEEEDNFAMMLWG